MTDHIRVLRHLNGNPLGQLCRRLLLEAGQEPHPGYLYAHQLALWVLEEYPDLLASQEQPVAYKLESFLASSNRPPRDQLALLLPGDLEPRHLAVASQQQVRKLQGLSPQQAGARLVQYLHGHLSQVPGFDPLPFP